MKIAIDRTKFQTALNAVRDVAASGADLQILQNIKIETTGDEEITLTATNLDQTISTKVKCQVKEPGATTIPAKLVIQMVGALTVPIVEFKQDGKTAKAVLTGGDVTYKIATIDAAEFPKPTPVEGTHIAFGQDELKKLLNKTSYAASVDTTRRSLVGVCIQAADNKVIAIATDGRRLANAAVEKEIDGSSEVILPSTTVKYLQRILGSEGDVFVTFSKSAALFESDVWSVQTKIVDDPYPNWRGVIPKTVGFEVPVDREALINAVRQVSISSNSNITLAIGKGVMTLTATEQDMADAKVIIPVKFDGEDVVRINFNPRYVIEAFSSFAEDTVKFGFNNGTSPVTVTADGVDSVAVMMPLRVS